MLSDTARQITTISAFVMTVVINALANIIPINGVTTGELSDRYEIFFVPAGYAFSIWSLIYLTQLGYVVYQALPRNKRNPLLRQIGPYFIASAIFNSGWIFAWHYQIIWLSVLLMLGLLISLILIYRKLGVGRFRVSRGESLFVRLPFSLYLGWITVATVVNITVYLESINWNGFGISEAIWAVIMLVVASLIAGLVSVRHRDWAYAAVIVWAFIGIAVKHNDTLVVAITAVIMALLVLLTPFVSQSRGVSLQLDG